MPSTQTLRHSPDSGGMAFACFAMGIPKKDGHLGAESRLLRFTAAPLLQTTLSLSVGNLMTNTPNHQRNPMLEQKRHAFAKHEVSLLRQTER